MTTPRNYDTWRLSGPEEPDEPHMETCPDCKGHGAFVIIEEAEVFIRGEPGLVNRIPKPTTCETCHGTGEVEADAEEYENERGDWLRDRRLEDG